MRELVVNTFLTLDGVMQAPGGPEEDTEGGFEHGGWSAVYWDDEIEQSMGDFMGKPFDLVLGRKTYEIFAAHWPNAPEDDLGAKALNSATKNVASNTLAELSWQNSKLIEPDVPTGVRALKQEDGPELQVHGSADLIQTLLEHDLIDEIRVLIYPLVLGAGKRLFGEGTHPTGFEVTESKVTPAGVIIAAYRPGAEIKYGSFAAEDPSEEELARREKQQL